MSDQLEPHAQRLIKETSTQLLDFLKHCTQEKMRHLEAAEFWTGESDAINRFLSENQMETTAAVQQTVEDIDPGYKPTDLRASYARR